MTILITAGGTKEHIDSVRSITNTSSGALSAIIHDVIVANALSSGTEIPRIHYVMANGQHMPKANDSTTIHRAYDTLAVKEVIENLLLEESIDIMIHAMAISDYYVTGVKSSKDLINDLESQISLADSLDNGYDQNSKIRDNNELILRLTPTPKIIHKVKELSPATKLIGFKLLSGVSRSELIDVATQTQRNNQCTFVVANDMTNINGTRHEAILVSENMVLKECTTKKKRLHSQSLIS